MPPRRIVTLAVVVLTLAGCTLRPETPTPSPLVPDATEQARDLASYETNDLMTLANQVLQNAPEESAPAVRHALRTCWTHYQGLGGIYYSAYPPELSLPRPSREITAYSLDIPGLIQALSDSATKLAADATAQEDSALAQLFASMAVARARLAIDLAAAADLETTPVFGTDLWEGTAPSLTDPPIAEIVTRLDSLGYGFEVMAARHADPIRSHALHDAAQLRLLANQLADLAGLAGTPSDSRLGAYQLPNDLRDPAVAVTTAIDWYRELATTWAALIVTAPPADRPWLIRALAAAENARLEWSPGTPEALPGLEEFDPSASQETVPAEEPLNPEEAAISEEPPTSEDVATE